MIRFLCSRWLIKFFLKNFDHNSINYYNFSCLTNSIISYCSMLLFCYIDSISLCNVLILFIICINRERKRESGFNRLGLNVIGEKPVLSIPATNWKSRQSLNHNQLRLSSVTYILRLSSHMISFYRAHRDYCKKLK